jgi:hypothetical protein
MATSTSHSGLDQLLTSVARQAKDADVFGPISRRGDTLELAARASAEPASFRLLVNDGSLWIALVTSARWLSQSIEADLVHTGDKIEDLLEEELIDQGLEGVRLSYEHFRDEQKLYTFRSKLPVELSRLGEGATADRVGKMLLAYEAAFRPLGDMEADDDE